MHICMVTSAPFPPAEGIGQYVWNLSRFLVGQGHEVQIVTRRQRGKPAHEVVSEIPIWRPRFYPAYPLHVHLHGLFVQRLIQRLESKVDLFHLHSPLPPPIRSRRPLLVTAHSTRVGAVKVLRVKDLNSLLTRLQVPISISIERQLFTRADHIAVVAQSVADELQSYGLGKKRITVLGNGVDTTIFCPNGQTPATPPREPYVLAAGRLSAPKGFQDLIEAMGHVVHQFPKVRLYIAGSGPHETQLRVQVEQMALQDVVRFLGHIKERSEMVKLYRSAAVFAHASHHEGLPTVLLEAMACGKAVVSTAVGGASDVIEHGLNGLLIAPRSVTQLAEAICHLLGDAALRIRLGSVAQDMVETRFSWQVVGRNHLHSYRTLLSKTHTDASKR